MKPKSEESVENTWIDLAISGDETAFSNLYHRYFGQVYSFCSRMLNGRSEVEDATQQVFFEAWKSLHRFEKRSLFSTWLTKIAIHICFGIYRRNARAIFLKDNSPEESNGPLPEDCLIERDRKKLVNGLLLKVSKKKRIVLKMSDLYEMSAAEISSRLGIPDATVRTRLFHARKEFARLIGGSERVREFF